MFDVSMIEVAVIALVALLVLGPEKLPRAARTAGLYMRKARASWHAIRTDIERELAAEDLKRAMKDTEQSLLTPPARHVPSAESESPAPATLDPLPSDPPPRD